MPDQQQTEHQKYHAQFKQWCTDNLPAGFLANDGERHVAWTMWQKLRPYIPPVNSQEAERAIEAMSEKYDFPTSPASCARVGWEAARTYQP